MVKEFFQSIFKFKEAPREKKTLVIQHVEPLGTHGTEIYSGYPNEEYLSNLQGTQRADIYDKMRRSDPQVKMCLSSVMSPILSAQWKVEPFDVDDPEAVEDAKMVEHILFELMDKTWLQTLREILTFIIHGYSVFEMIDGVAETPKYGTLSVIKSLSFRSQRTIETWNIDRDTRKLKSVTQIVNGDLDVYTDIPAEFLVIFTLDKEGSNYEGISALRSIYGNWLRKNAYLKLNAIGIEKFAVPTPIVTVPSGMESNAQYDSMVAVLQKYLTHEQNYITKPEGWEIELNNSAYDPQKVEVSIDNEDKRMVKNFMANFLELGLNGFGSQSLSFDLSDFFLSSLDQYAQIVSEQMNQVVIPRLVRMNRGKRKGYPYLKHCGISDKAGMELANVLKVLADGRLITPDHELEEDLRDRFGLPEQKEVEEIELAPVTPPATPLAMSETTPRLNTKLKQLRKLRG